MRILFEHTRLRRVTMLTALVLLILAGSAAMVFADESAATQPLRLRAHIESQDAVLRFGDVFSNAGPLAQSVLARAPNPGRTVSLDPAWLEATARAKGRVWRNTASLKRIKVSRSGARIGSEQVRALIAAELQRRGDGADYDIDLANRMQTLFTPLGAAGDLRLLDLDFNRQNGVFTARIQPYAGARPVNVQGRAWAQVQVPALIQAHRAGELITPSDVQWIKVRQARLRPDTVLEVNAIEGKQTRRSVRAGQPLRSADFQRPAIVSRGQIVTIIYHVPGLRITARGRALAEAGLGEPLRVVNVQSSRTIDVVVTGPGTASASTGFTATIGGKETSS